MSVKIIALFDMSGSMDSMMRVKPTPVDTMNEFIKDQQSLKLEGTMSMYFFNDTLIQVFTDRDIQKVEPITLEQYKPDHSTALYESIAGVIEQNESKEGKESEKNFMVIMTDGQENASDPKYTQNYINGMIKEKKKQGWMFKFLGTNQDAWESGAKMGLAQHECATFAPCSQGLSVAMRAVSGQVRGLRMTTV